MTRRKKNWQQLLDAVQETRQAARDGSDRQPLAYGYRRYKEILAEEVGRA